MRTPLVVLLLLVSVAPVRAVTEPEALWRNGGPRLRPYDSRVATLLRVGLDRSPTLRALVDRVEESRVIVYLEMQSTIRGQLSGCLTWIAAADSFRYVRASINPDLNVDQQIAAIAHELQHAVEIAEHRHVTSEAAMVALYRRIGDQRRSGPSHWDTAEARAVGTTVRRELVQTAPSMAADVPASITPVEWHAFYRSERARLGFADTGSRF
jgi:hypothetical protein